MMRTVFKKHKKKCVINTTIFLTLFLSLLYAQSYNYIGNQEVISNLGNNKVMFFSQGPTNETTAPIITFIKPDFNNTIITQGSYTIIANISDENPPLNGNVIIQISNFTNSLFNATMNYDIESQWIFIWNNISLYHNQFYIGYIIQIWAKDSSTNGNIGFSEEYYIYLNLPGQSPGVINVVLYLLAVSVIIAVIVVYLNKKLIHKTPPIHES